MPPLFSDVHRTAKPRSNPTSYASWRSLLDGPHAVTIKPTKAHSSGFEKRGELLVHILSTLSLWGTAFVIRYPSREGRFDGVFVRSPRKKSSRDRYTGTEIWSRLSEGQGSRDEKVDSVLVRGPGDNRPKISILSPEVEQYTVPGSRASVATTQIFPPNGTAKIAIIYGHFHELQFDGIYTTKAKALFLTHKLHGDSQCL